MEVCGGVPYGTVRTDLALKGGAVISGQGRGEKKVEEKLVCLPYSREGPQQGNK